MPQYQEVERILDETLIDHFSFSPILVFDLVNTVIRIGAVFYQQLGSRLVQLFCVGG